MGVNNIIKEIKKNSKFLIASHVNAEGDALGSELALAALLKKMGKKVCIVNSEKPSANYGFLPGIKMIRQKVGDFKFDVVFVVDCPVIQRIGALAGLLDKDKRIVTIDHHMDNKRFGRANWVDPKASSTGEMIYRLFHLMRVNMDKRDALNIYAAILTDTGSFRHANTTSEVLKIASDLLNFGITPAKVYTRIYENNTREDMMFVAKVISGMHFIAGGEIAWAEIKKGVCKKIEGKTELIDKILDFGKSVDSVQVVAIFYQLGDQSTKVSLRSKAPVNVQKVAKVFGGGGHRCASGCRIKSELQTVKSNMLREIKAELAHY
ncbi:MAG: bifunctional oligoribonuclease/PAP phosphatase NrnA [Candidatus Omnitrophica bacterium]|nr:bifunctional oligoribonuclease/PAP phosphatase NrnA [Candidatus Omnitrophota bacterium]